MFTREKFLSGRRGPPSRYEPHSMYFDEFDRKYYLQDDASVSVSETDKFDVIWYKTEDEAVQAAAARVLDCIRFRQYPQVFHNMVQLCKEHPYGYQNGPSNLCRHRLRRNFIPLYGKAKQVQMIQQVREQSRTSKRKRITAGDDIASKGCLEDQHLSRYCLSNFNFG